MLHVTRLMHRNTMLRAFSTNKGKMVPYTVKYFPAIYKIAMDNLKKLVSKNYGQSDEEAFDRNVYPCLKKETALVYLEAKKPKAFVTFSKGSAHLSIEQLAVAKSLHKKGTGSTLVERIIALAKEENALFVSVSVNDTKLETFYGKLGFKSIQRSTTPVTKSYLCIMVRPTSEENGINQLRIARATMLAQSTTTVASGFFQVFTQLSPFLVTAYLMTH